MGQGDVPGPDVLVLLAEHWDDVLAHLDPGAREELTALLALSEGEFDQARAAAVEDFLLDHLPPDHPVNRALAEASGLMLHPGAVADRLSLADFQRRIRPAPTVLVERLRPDSSPETDPDPEPGPSPDLDPEPDVDLDVPPHPGREPDAGARSDPSGLPDWRELHREVCRRLLSLPGRRFRGDGDLRGEEASGLIRLEDVDDQRLLPDFQFDPDGRPWPVVLDVNRILAAGDDPWGVTSWWVDAHAGLGTAPYRLLGNHHDDVLRRLARSAGQN